MPRRTSHKTESLTRVVLAEDHVLLRDLMAHALSRDSLRIRVVASVPTVRAAVRACLELKADLLLLRIALVGCDDQIAIARMRKRIPHLKILLYAGPPATDQRILRAIRIGVDGFVGKTNSAGDLLDAVNHVRGGDPSFSGEGSRLLAQFAGGDSSGEGRKKQMSPRENEILGLIASGFTSKEIAHSLGLSTATIETHRRNLMAKAKAHNVAGLIRYAHRHDLLRLNPS